MSSKLTFEALTFTNADNTSDGNVTFTDSEILLDKPFQSSTITIEGTINGSASTSFSGTAFFPSCIADSILLKGQKNVSLESESPDTNQTVSLPLPGLANQYLKYESTGPSTGSLSWQTISVDGTASREQSWIFGTIKQLWSIAYGNPFATSSDPPVGPSGYAPIVSSGYRGTTLNNPTYNTDSATNHHLLLFENYVNAQSVISWDMGSKLDSNPISVWEMKVTLRLRTPYAIANTAAGRVQGGFTLFGNDTIQTVSSGPSGGSYENMSGVGISVEFYNSTSPGSPYMQVRCVENGTIVGSADFGGAVLDNQYRTYRIQRRDNTLRFEMIGNGNTSDESLHAFIEFSLSTSPTGTRWGILDQSGVSNCNHETSISYIEARAVV